jgi:large subunit ribosomal protein L24
MQIKKGDKVQIIAGKDKGKTGVVVSALPKKDRVIVEGINMVKKHTKPSQANQQGGIVEFEAPIHVSNVAVLDPKENTPTRVGFKVVDNKKVRYAKKSGEILDK